MKKQFLARPTSWKISLLSLVFFQFVFVFVLVRYGSAIIIVPGQDISYEYWDWWLSLPKTYLNAVDALDGTAQIFQMLFGGEILFLLWKNRRRPHMPMIAVGLLFLTSGLLLGWRYYCIPNLLHYRMFMKLFPSEILAVILMLTLMVDAKQSRQQLTDKDK